MGFSEGQFRVLISDLAVHQRPSGAGMLGLLSTLFVKAFFFFSFFNW